MAQNNDSSAVAFHVIDTTYPTGWIPDKTHQLVNDYAHILTTAQQQTLEQRLVAFDDSTSNQVMILIVPDMGGDEIASFTQNVWRQWGVGSQQYNNGVIIVVKPRNSTRGQVRIQTGYGLEGALPDIFCSQIIQDEMIPHFQHNEYYEGIVAALDVILPVCAGEYSYQRYQADHQSNGLVYSLITLAIIVVIIILLSRRHGGGSPPFIYYGTSNGASIGSWGSFSGGGFSGGGFGGFGGGLSGGGGASGSW